MPRYPATHAWKATEADAFGDPLNPDTFQIRFVVQGDYHDYQLRRETLRQLGRHIERALSEPSTPVRE